MAVDIIKKPMQIKTLTAKLYTQTVNFTFHLSIDITQ